MAINLYSKASVDSLLSAKLSISSLTNAAATTLNATAPTTGQVLSFDGTELKWATPAGGATWGSITGTLSSQSDLNTALNARVSTAGDTMDNNALLEFNDTTTNSHLGITGNAVTIENAGLGLSSTLDKDKLSITDGTDTAEISLSGVKFADGTTQTTAYTGGGGSWLGNRISIYSGYLYNEDTSSNVSTLTLQGSSTVNARNLTLQASGGGVLTFADATTQSTAAVGIPSAGATGQVLSKASGTNYDVAWTNASGADVQVFGSSSSSGSFTWTKPTGAKIVEFYLVGGGAGGGSGARKATTFVRFGGGAGSGGPANMNRIHADYLGSTETVVVGAGGAGGASASTDGANGNSGSNGGATTFSLFKSGNGQAGTGGTTSAGTGGSGAPSVSYIGSTTTLGAGAAGASTTGSGATGYSNYWTFGTGGGGGAGAAASVTTNASGGAGGSWTSVTHYAGLISAIAGGTGGTSGGTAATDGTSLTTQRYIGGTGGGGGFYRTGQAGGTGGNGGWPGGGGGGGGASDNGFASGAGGNGANGLAVIITYF